MTGVVCHTGASVVDGVAGEPCQGRVRGMKAFIRCSVAVACALCVFRVCRAQDVNTSARGIVGEKRALSPAAVAQVMDAILAAMAGQTFKVTPLPVGPALEWEIQMDSRGGPRYLRTARGNGQVSFADYTGRPAKTCSGQPIAEELVITYARMPGVPWDVKGRARTDDEPLSDYFALFRFQLESRTVAQIDGREARAFVAPWRVRPGDAPELVAQVKQTLWIDVESLLPLRWEMTREGTPTGYGLIFTHRPSLRLRPPEGVAAPECVPDR